MSHFRKPDGIKYFFLTVSLFPLDAKPRTDGSMTLQCTLVRYGGYSPCTQNSIQWVDDTGTALLSEDTVFNTGNTVCVTKLTVHLSAFNRRYTCHFVERISTRIYAEYTPVVIGDNNSVPGKIHTKYNIIVSMNK